MQPSDRAWATFAAFLPHGLYRSTCHWLVPLPNFIDHFGAGQIANYGFSGDSFFRNRGKRVSQTRKLFSLNALINIKPLGTDCAKVLSLLNKETKR
jgi:hypothetical protein